MFFNFEYHLFVNGEIIISENLSNSEPLYDCTTKTEVEIYKF